MGYCDQVYYYEGVVTWNEKAKKAELDITLLSDATFPCNPAVDNTGKVLLKSFSEVLGCEKLKVFNLRQTW